MGDLRRGYLSYVQGGNNNDYSILSRYNANSSITTLQSGNDFPNYNIKQYQLYKTQIYNGTIRHILGTTIVRTAYDSTYQIAMRILVGAYENANGAGESRTIDYAYVRKYVYPEPTYGAWNLEEYIVCVVPICNLNVT